MLLAGLVASHPHPPIVESVVPAINDSRCANVHQPAVQNRIRGPGVPALSTTLSSNDRYVQPRFARGTSGSGRSETVAALEYFVRSRRPGSFDHGVVKDMPLLQMLADVGQRRRRQISRSISHVPPADPDTAPAFAPSSS